MIFRIELVATAKADIHGQAQWLRENVSPAAATKWLDGLYKAIDTLQTLTTLGVQLLGSD
jgi:plasmid stabilization system protein ParE